MSDEPECADPLRYDSAAYVRALEDQVALLREALGLTYPPPPKWGLTRNQARFVGILLKVKIASRERFMAALYAGTANPPNDKIVDVTLCHVRKKLKPLGVEIRNSWGVGYWIPEEQKRLLDA